MRFTSDMRLSSYQLLYDVHYNSLDIQKDHIGSFPRLHLPVENELRALEGIRNDTAVDCYTIIAIFPSEHAHLA